MSRCAARYLRRLFLTHLSRFSNSFWPVTVVFDCNQQHAASEDKVGSLSTFAVKVD